MKFIQTFFLLASVSLTAIAADPRVQGVQVVPNVSGTVTGLTARATLNIFGPREYGEIPVTGATPSLSFTNGPVYTETLSATDITISLANGIGTSGLTNRPIDFRVTTDGTHNIVVPASVYAMTPTNGQPYAAGVFTYTFAIEGGRTNLYLSPDPNTYFAAGISGQYNALTVKSTPTTSDILPIEDAAASNAKKKITIGTLPANSSTQTGTHASPSTSNPLSPTWTGPMHTVWYGATGTINLPAVSTYAGRAILIYNTGAFTITIDPNASEVVVRDGTVQTGGVNFTLSSGAGNYVAIFCDGARWITLGFKGTLAVGS